MRSGQFACKSEALRKLAGRRNISHANPAAARRRSYRADSGKLQVSVGPPAHYDSRWSCGDIVKSSCLSAHSYRAQTPASHRRHLRTARRAWRTVVRATQTPSNSCPAHAASNSYLRHHIVRGSKRCRRHSLCRRCDCQREACNSDQLEHCSPPIAVPVNLLSAYPPSGLRLAIDQGRVTGPTVLAHGRRKSARKSRSACSPVIVPGHMPVRTMAIGAIVPCTHLP